MMIDSTDLIRKLPAMIQGNRKFAKIADGGDYHTGDVDSWCLSYSEIVKGIEDYCESVDVDAVRQLPSVTPQPKVGYISIDDVMAVFDDFMHGDVDENNTETFLEMLKDKAEGSEE